MHIHQHICNRTNKAEVLSNFENVIYPDTDIRIRTIFWEKWSVFQGVPKVASLQAWSIYASVGFFSDGIHCLAPLPGYCSPINANAHKTLTHAACSDFCILYALFINFCILQSASIFSHSYFLVCYLYFIFCALFYIQCSAFLCFVISCHCCSTPMNLHCKNL